MAPNCLVKSNPTDNNLIQSIQTKNDAINSDQVILLNACKCNSAVYPILLISSGTGVCQNNCLQGYFNCEGVDT